MEAVAKHGFSATADDELSFSKGETLKIIEMCEDQNWYKAEHKGKEGWIPENYIDVKPHEWFMFKMKRTEAEAHLLEKDENGSYINDDGAFLVRYSESTEGEFSLSVKVGDHVQHYKVLRDGDGKYFLWVVKFNSLNDLIKYHRQQSVSRTQTIFLTNRKVLTIKRKADYNYEAQEQEELSIYRGDLITVLDKKDPNWWQGEVCRDGKIFRGLFPHVYTSPHNT